MNSTLESDLKKQGNFRHSSKQTICLPYSVVREYIKHNNFKTVGEYQYWLRSQREEGKCYEFPMHPQVLYVRRNEWISTKHFLGKTDDTTPTHRAKYKEEVVEQHTSQNVGWRIIAQIFGLGKNKQHS